MSRIGGGGGAGDYEQIKNSWSCPRELVSWCLKPSQPQTITSVLSPRERERERERDRMYSLTSAHSEIRHDRNQLVRWIVGGHGEWRE